MLQRDLKKSHALKEGTFALDLTTESHPGEKSGMSGTLKFTPNEKAPDSTLIKLYQVVRNEDLSTGADYVWTGPLAAVTGVQTTTDTRYGVKGGWGVDHVATAVAPRTHLADPVVGMYYRDTQPNASVSQNGSKKGAKIVGASLWDYPGWNQKMRWSFETVAQATDTGHVYGAVTWGFANTDPDKGAITGERSGKSDTASPTAKAAVRRFNEYYRNPGSSTAPTV